MKTRCVEVIDGKRPRPVDIAEIQDARDGWLWIDIEAGPESRTADLQSFASIFGLDELAMHDVVGDRDLPKVDDFGDHMLIVVHGLSHDRGTETQEIDCFITDRHLFTFRTEPSPSTDAVWESLLARSALGEGGSVELLARLCDVITRRVLAVIDAFEDRVDSLLGDALEAEPKFLADLTAVRSDLGHIRQIIHPQREVFDLLRRSESRLISDSARRRFSDVFDVTERTAHGLELVRAGLSEALDAYRGAEARRAADVSSVLTIYAAIMLPLSLIVGFFGMNHQNLPTTSSQTGWQWVAAAMGIIVVASLAVFVRAGWIRSPTIHSRAVGRGLKEASQIPVRLVDSLYTTSRPNPGRPRRRPKLTSDLQPKEKPR